MALSKIFLIGNPKSGRARLKSDLFDIVNVLSGGGNTVTVYLTKKKGDAAVMTENLSDEYDTVICCGGDGTLNEVVSGMMKNKNRYKLGYIPLGTLNEWSSNLKISKKPRQAALDILKGETRSLDIGKFNDKYFVYTASFGAFTSASYSTPQNVKNLLGSTAYFFEGVKGITSIKPTHLKLTINNEEIEGDYIFGSISNSLSMGGIIKLDKNSVEFDDGLFEVLLIENPKNLAEFNAILDAIATKKFEKAQIKYFKTSSITMHSNSSVPWTLDGEYAKGTADTTIENINKAVDFILPPTKN